MQLCPTVQLRDFGLSMFLLFKIRWFGVNGVIGVNSGISWTLVPNKKKNNNYMNLLLTGYECKPVKTVPLTFGRSYNTCNSKMSDKQRVWWSLSSWFLYFSYSRMMPNRTGKVLRGREKVFHPHLSYIHSSGTTALGWNCVPQNRKSQEETFGANQANATSSPQLLTSHNSPICD